MRVSVRFAYQCRAWIRDLEADRCPWNASWKDRISRGRQASGIYSNSGIEGRGGTHLCSVSRGAHCTHSWSQSMESIWAFTRHLTVQNGRYYPVAHILSLIHISEPT